MPVKKRNEQTLRPPAGSSTPPLSNNLATFSSTPLGKAQRYVPAEDAVIVDRKLREDDGKCSIPLAFGAESRPFPIYPYAQGPDLANDGMGYGEELRIKVYRIPKAVPLNGEAAGPSKPSASPIRLDAAIGCHRRTRSGRQFASDE